MKLEFRQFRKVLSFTLATGALLTGQAKLSLDAPGHVYTERERATARGGTAGAAWTLTDWRGRALASGTFSSDGRAALGKRPVGYYHLKSADEDATFAVVPVPEGRVRDAASFYGIDSAQSWVSRPGSFDCPWYGGDSYRLVSDLLWRTGLAHVRERLRAAEVNPRPGVYEYSHYMYNADMLRARGITVSGMFHDVPDYMDGIQKLPRNLAALYAFCRDTAAAFGGRMGDWEFWNEQDIGFAPEPVWDYVAALKAAYLGFKTGRPGITVLPGAVCHATRNAYDAGMYANDAAKYSDVFNFHTYSPISGYPDMFNKLRAFMKKVGISGRAVWVTESGTNLEGHSDEDGAVKGQKAHSPAQELVHAEFYAKSQIAFQMQGVSRNYFFVFGAYNERNGAKDWGVMRRDGTVKPTYAAMSTIARELATARLEGEIRLGKAFKGYLFAQPDGSQTLAFWSVSPVDTANGTAPATPDYAAPLALPIPPSGAYMLTDLCGQRTPLATNVVTATRYTSYLSGLRGLKADVPPVPCGTPTPVVPAADEDLSVVFRIDLNTNDFRIADHKSVAELHADAGRLRVQAWNLSPVAKRGTVSVSGGALSGLPAEIALPPMGVAAFDCTYVAQEGAPLVEPLVLSGLFAGRRTSRLVMPVRNLKAFLANCRTTELRNWRDPNAWRRNTSADRFAAVWDEAEQALRFDFAWTKPADRWFYPTYTLTLPEESFDGALMFEFEVKSTQDKVENDFNGQNLMLVFADPARPARVISYPAPLTGWETRRIDLTSGPSNAKPGTVKAIRLGANPKGMTGSFWIRNPRLLKCGAAQAAADRSSAHDVVIYGSSPAALTAAIEAQRHGRTAVVVCPETRIGGLTTGGLGQTDIGNKSAFGGLARQFYRDVAAWYGDARNWKWERRSDYRPNGQCTGTQGDESMWTFEPSAALAILERWEKENGLEIVRGEYLDRAKGGVTVADGRIVSFRTLSGRTFRGKVFVDATYEGDLMAAAGVSYTVGREANAVYGETISGIQRRLATNHQMNPGVSAYVKAGDPSSGLLPGVEPDVADPDGAGDRRVQAYCFRMCLTDNPENRIPFVKPANYDPRDYELLLRNLEVINPKILAEKADSPRLWKFMPWSNSRMPNRKTDTNNRMGFSTDFIGGSWDWPEASYAEREKILQRHLDYQMGLMWTLANDPRVPEPFRAHVARWGTCRDEFADGLGHGWQRQLYVREARRLVGEYVMTERNCRGTVVAPRPVAMGAYGMDSHNVRRYVDAQGFVRNEGNIEDYSANPPGQPHKRFGPYPIDYGAIVPKRVECRNLFVPVCLSASHMAFGSIRMEPVFFALGQVAGAAAALAVEGDCAVQDVPYETLAATLRREGCVIGK